MATVHAVIGKGPVERLIALMAGRLSAIVPALFVLYQTRPFIDLMFNKFFTKKTDGAAHTKLNWKILESGFFLGSYLALAILCATHPNPLMFLLPTLGLGFVQFVRADQVNKADKSEKDISSLKSFMRFVSNELSLEINSDELVEKEAKSSLSENTLAISIDVNENEVNNKRPTIINSYLLTQISGSKELTTGYSDGQLHLKFAPKK